MFLSSLSTNNIKPINNTVYKKYIKKNIIFFLIHLHRYRDAINSCKIQGNFVKKKNIIKKNNFSSFSRTVMYEILKCLQSHLYREIKRLYQKPVFWVFFFFSVLGTKTINNGIHSIWESKTKLLKTCFSSVLRRKSLKRNRITLPKRYILSVFERKLM